jgi:hypothetical protein
MYWSLGSRKFGRRVLRGQDPNALVAVAWCLVLGLQQRFGCARWLHVCMWCCSSREHPEQEVEAMRRNQDNALMGIQNAYV